VFLGNLIYLKLNTSKLSETCSIVYGMDLFFMGENFKFLSEDSDTQKVVHVHSSEREKNPHILEKLS
jgi:hypothetical protein